MYSYGEDDLNQTEHADDKESGDEDSRDSNSVSISPLKVLILRTIQLDSTDIWVYILSDRKQWCGSGVIEYGAF